MFIKWLGSLTPIVIRVFYVIYFVHLKKIFIRCFANTEKYVAMWQYLVISGDVAIFAIILTVLFAIILAVLGEVDVCEKEIAALLWY